MNFVFVSPNFPLVYSKFVKSLNEHGFQVLGIGDTPWNNLNDELKENLTCYYEVWDLTNLNWKKEAIKYYINKFGPISYLESNNEFWLMDDACLREYGNVAQGLRPIDMDKIKYKSKMKEGFINADVKVARYTLVTSLEVCLNFAKEVGYPVFVKPDNGVGASHSYKLKNEDDIRSFYKTKDDTLYIMEEFINGEITSFDGIANENAEVVLAFNENFPTPIDKVVNDDLDMFYYASTRMDDEFYQMGQRVVKSFNIQKRCFHIEFFRLKEDRPGLAKKGEIIALEVNMRCPGGDTPDLLSIAMDGSFYDAYADMMKDNKLNFTLSNNQYVAISADRKNNFNYVHTSVEILNKYGSNIVKHGSYPKEFRDAMGDEFYIARFLNKEEALKFQEYVLQKI